jgi:hypothetical protein
VVGHGPCTPPVVDSARRLSGPHGFGHRHRPGLRCGESGSPGAFGWPEPVGFLAEVVRGTDGTGWSGATPERPKIVSRAAPPPLPHAWSATHGGKLTPGVHRPHHSRCGPRDATPSWRSPLPARYSGPPRRPPVQDRTPLFSGGQSPCTA